MKFKYLSLAILVTAFVGLTACNSELESNDSTPTNPVSPVNPVPPPSEPDEPDEEPDTWVGTWENKDEDGDGVPDIYDDFPFDPDRSALVTFVEEEFNNNIAQANFVGTLPVRIAGAIDTELDIDTFRFEITADDIAENKRFTFIIFRDSVRFMPRLTLLTNGGQVIQTVPTLMTPVGRVAETLSFKPDAPGHYNISVADKYNNFSADFSYTLEAFVDNDMDGVDDIKELALGMDPTNPDMDGDGIVDGNEYWVFINGVLNHDVDSDGVPNWLDLDSDGDGIADAIEGLLDMDGDGLPNFVDLDSDGDGVPDSQHLAAGTHLLDTSGNGIPDYADIDDDGDGLLDIYDSEPLSVLLTHDEGAPNAVRFDRVYKTLENGIELAFSVSPATAARVEGQGFVPDNTVLVLRKAGDILSENLINIPLNVLSENTAEFTVPDYIHIPVGGTKLLAFIVVDGKATRTIELNLLDRKAPELFELDRTSILSGETVYVTGRNISSTTYIVFSNSRVRLNRLSSSEASFVAPSDVASGAIYLANEFGQSNELQIAARRSLDVSVALPPALQAVFADDVLLLVSDASDEEIPLSPTQLDASVTLQVKAGQLGAVSVYWWSGAELIEILSGIYDEQNSKLTLDLETTAETVVLHGLFQSLSLVKGNELRAALAALEEYTDFKEYFSTGVLNDPSFSSFSNVALRQQVFQLQQQLEQALTQSINAFASSKSQLSRQQLGRLQQMKVERVRVAADPDSQRPIITPDDSQDRINLEPTRSGIMGLFRYDGYTELKNSTQMYLSTAVYDIEYDNAIERISSSPAVGFEPNIEGQQKVYRHINSYVDRDMNSPVSFAAFSFPIWSSDKLLKVCPYSDCLVEVITPGNKGLELTDSEKIAVRKKLFIRNLIDRAIWPTIQLTHDALTGGLGPTQGGFSPRGYIKDRNGFETGMHITDLVISALPPLFNAIEVAFEDGYVSEAEMTDIMQELENILENERQGILTLNPGPLVRAIYAAMGFDIAGYLRAVGIAVVQRVASSFVPGLNVILNSIQVLEAISRGANIGRSWYELWHLEQYYHFKVTWGLRLLEMTPPVVEISNHTVSLEFKGTGLCPIKGIFRDTYPTVVLTDIVHGARYEHEMNNRGELFRHYSYNAACNEASVYIPGQFWLSLQPDSRVAVDLIFGSHQSANSVEHDTSPNYITVGQGLSIDNVTPDPVFTGQELVLNGNGFSAIPSDNNVTFVAENGGRVSALVRRATSQQLTVIVPDNAASGILRLEVDGSLAEFDVEVTRVEITISYGDNGNLLDDSFQVVLDGRVVSESDTSRRNHRVTVPTEPGQRELSLIGITVPDNRATYYICLSSNVEVVRGEPSASVDFDEGDQFSTHLLIHVKAEPNQGVLNCEFFDSNTGQSIELWQDKVGYK
ncbi:thrombospondin type 3 repeat-containing protein [Alkalimonas mucilaginosa]|uniref:IPT/TIG domain-containing protein n=1 Tax=Alkalimonas mucilaginosa TaxID=3057676 RepID=A0ABU7JJ98_9GAMM|nr:hypothetical protein [Alkalimonas sp. MEB004]MEE2025772.1 hypothetical protein [Alkalimonas sp. MEB004]